MMNKTVISTVFVLFLSVSARAQTGVIEGPYIGSFDPEGGGQGLGIQIGDKEGRFLVDVGSNGACLNVLHLREIALLNKGDWVRVEWKQRGTQRLIVAISKIRDSTSETTPPTTESPHRTPSAWPPAGTTSGTVSGKMRAIAHVMDSDGRERTGVTIELDLTDHEATFVAARSAQGNGFKEAINQIALIKRLVNGNIVTIKWRREGDVLMIEELSSQDVGEVTPLVVAPPASENPNPIPRQPQVIPKEPLAGTGGTFEGTVAGKIFKMVPGQPRGTSVLAENIWPGIVLKIAEGTEMDLIVAAVKEDGTPNATIEKELTALGTGRRIKVKTRFYAGTHWITSIEKLPARKF